MSLSSHTSLPSLAKDVVLYYEWVKQQYLKKKNPKTTINLYARVFRLRCCHRQTTTVLMRKHQLMMTTRSLSENAFIYYYVRITITIVILCGSVRSSRHRVYIIDIRMSTCDSEYWNFNVNKTRDIQIIRPKCLMQPRLNTFLSRGLSRYYYCRRSNWSNRIIIRLRLKRTVHVRGFFFH